MTPLIPRAQVDAILAEMASVHAAYAVKGDPENARNRAAAEAALTAARRKIAALPGVEQGEPA